MQISERLKAVANLVTPGKILADVGTDHAYLPIYLFEQKKIKKAIAMDINEGPLMRAQTNIETHGLNAYISTRLSDGVQALKPGEVSSMVVAGMGGFLVQKIMEQGSEILKTMDEYILQPQSEISQVRLFLFENGYKIVDEDMVFEDGKYYFMMKAVRASADPLQKEELAFGPCLLQKKHPVLKQYLVQKKESLGLIYQNISENKSQRTIERSKELREEMQLIDAAMKHYERE